MIKTANRGAIVNISSISAIRPRGLTVYTASKGAVIALTRAMAVDHAKDGIRVNCVAPGPVYTPMVYERGMSPQARDQRRKASALGRRGHRLGHRQRRALPAVRPRPLHHGPDAGRRRRRDPAIARPRQPKPLQKPRKHIHGPRTLSRQVRPGARGPGSAQAHHHAASRARSQSERPQRVRRARRSSSATRAGSTRACASSPSCRSATWRARPMSGRTMSRSAATSASATTTSAP